MNGSKGVENMWSAMYTHTTQGHIHMYNTFDVHVYVYTCTCTCICVYIYMYIHVIITQTQTHTHTHRQNFECMYNYIQCIYKGSNHHDIRTMYMLHQGCIAIQGEAGKWELNITSAVIQ